MRGRSKKFLTAGITAVLLFGFAAFWTFPPGERILAHAIMTNLSRLLGADVTVERLETNLVSWVRLLNLQISDAQKAGGASLTCRDLTIHYALFPLIRDRIRLNEIDAESLFFHANANVFDGKRQTGNGVSPHPTQSSRIKVDVRRVRLRRGCVVFQDTLRMMDFSACGLRIEAVQNETLDFGVDADSLLFRLQDRILPTSMLALRGRLGDETLTLDTCRIAIPGLEISGDGRLALIGDHILDARFQMSGDPSPLYKTLRLSDIPAPKGTIEADLQVSGSVSDPKVIARVFFESLRLDTLLLTDGRMRLTWQKRRIALDTLMVSVLGGRFDGRGTVDLNVPAFSITADARSLSFAALWSLMTNRPSPFRGQIYAQTVLEGNGRSWMGWHFRMNGNTEGFSYFSKSLDPIRFDGRFSGGALSAVLSQGSTRVETTLEIRRNRIEGRFTASIPSLEVIGALAGQPELEGSLTARGQVSGALEDPSLEAEIHAEAVRYRQFPLDRLDGGFRYENHQAAFKNLTFEGSRATEDTTALFGFDGFRGGLRYSGTLNGAITAPSGNCTITLDTPEWRSQRFDSGMIRARLIPDSLIIEDVILASDSVLIQAAGRMARRPLSGLGRLSLFSRAGISTTSTDTLDMKNLGRISYSFQLLPEGIEARVAGHRFNLAPISLWFPEWSPGGKADFLAQIHPGRRGQFEGFIESIRLRNLAADSLNIRTEWTSDEINLEHLSLHHAGEQAEISGRIPVLETLGKWPEPDRTQPVLIQARSTRFDMGFLAPLFPEGWRIKGRCDADLRLEGTLSVPRLDGDLSIADAGVRFQEQAFLDSTQIQLHLSNRKARLENLTGLVYGLQVSLTGEAALGLRDTQARIEGLIANRASLKLDGRIQSDVLTGSAALTDFDLSLLSGFIPAAYAPSGNARMEVDFSGTVADPALNGHLFLSDVSLKPVPWVSAIKTNNLRIRFTGHRVEIDTARFTTERGTMICSGNLVHQNRKISTVLLNSRIQNVAITEKDQFRILVKNAAIRISQDSTRREIASDIQLADSRYVGRVDVKQILDRLRAPKRPAVQSTGSAGWVLDIRLHDSPDVWIDNNLAHIRMKPEIQIRGTTNRPAVSGRVTATEGYFTYLDRKFTLQSAALDFSDPYRINPVIDIDAKSELKGYQTFSGLAFTIQLRVTGPADQAVVRLTSEPTLSEPDIISLLTLGTTRKTANGGDPSGRDVTLSEVLQERAAQLSSRRLSGFAAHKIGLLLGMEEVTIEGNLFKFGKSWGPQLLASKKITDRMEVTYSSTIGNMNEQSIRLDYRLSKVFSIEGQTDQKGRAGLDLKYRIKFK